ncbi:pentatricopeptide repeat-containing protein At1g73710 isoform X2 [Trifolium pratense]|uniref:pentatricopeptide repeat-containing protein At1g73710 isoform X2 n=1 Tax=Trifolium pratense TaxID=57577 RepID=UPI001E691459|nr:pentatricopeptide repeat-containing protein At1g73710 isoform X2 [Trifolium pratense]
MSCADKFPVSSSSLSSSSSSSSSSKFVTTIFTKPLLGPFPMLNPRWVYPRLTCFLSNTPHLPTKASSFINNNTEGKKEDKESVVTTIVKSLALSDDVEDTLELFGENLSLKEITVILRLQENWERAVRAFKWFKSKEGYVHNAIHYNVVLRILGRAQQWDELRLCWIDMAKNNVLPTNNTYSMLVDCYGKAGLAKEALLWIKHMMMRGFFPDEVTMSTVVKVLKEVREFDRADRFYKNWHGGKVDLDDLDFDTSSAFTTADGSKSSVPISLKQFLSTELFKIGGGIRDSNDIENQNPLSTFTYNTLIDLYGKAGRLQDAADVFVDMMKSGVALDSCTFNTMISISGRHGNLLEAESLLVKMEEKGISPNTRTYNILLSLYANAGNIDAAVSCYRRIEEAGLVPNVVTYIALFGVLCTENMVQVVEAVIDEMEKSSVSINERSLLDIVKMYVNAGDLDKANDLLEKFQMNWEPSSKICASIMDAFAEKGYWAEAESMFYRKRDMAQLQKRDIVEFNVMIKAYGKAKLYDKAVSLFEEMKNQGVWPNDNTYRSIIQMLSGADLVDQARSLTVEMLEMGFKPNCKTFSAVIGCYARLGQLSEAVDVYQEMLRAGVKPNEVVYGSIINGFAEHGSLDEALQYFHLMKESGLSANLVVLSTLLKSYSKVGDLEGVKSIYEQMQNMEGSLDLVASNSMITAFAELGLVSEAKQTFENLKETGCTNSTSYEIIMDLYKDVGLIDEAIKIAEEMKLLGLLNDCVSYNKVLICYAVNKQYHECVELLREMISKKILLNGRTFNLLLTILKKGEFPTEAIVQLESCYQEGKPYALQATYTAMYSLLGMHALALESCQTLLESEVENLDSAAYNVAIYVYTSAGYFEKALNIYMKMRDKRVEPDIVTHINLVVCYGKAGMVEGVKKIHRLLEYGEIEQSESLLQAIKYAYKHCNRKFRRVMRFNFDSEENSEDESETEYDVGSEGETEYDVRSEIE